MAKLQYRSISKRTVEALKVEKDTVFWDRELTGFGVRAYPSGSRYYVAQRPGGRRARSASRWAGTGSSPLIRHAAARR